MSTPDRRSLPGPLRDLPIFWKLLLPFVVLLLIVGGAGAYVIVRDLTAKSAAALSEQLRVRAIDARSVIHDTELDLLESANYATNLEGMPRAVVRRDADAVTDLLQSVQALKPDLATIAVTAVDGTLLAEAKSSGVDWNTSDPVTRARAAPTTKTAGFVLTAQGHQLMVMVAPVCSAAPCVPAGFAIVGVSVDEIATRIAATSGEGDEKAAIFALDGALLSSTASSGPPPRLGSPSDIVQRIDGDVAHGFTAFTLAGQPAGTVSVTMPNETAFSAVRGATLRLVGVLAAAMAAAVIIGAGVSRLILRQLRAVVHTSRALGTGDLSARAPVLSGDEHGELALVLNQMADQLQAERASLELQVDQRTEEIRHLLRDRSDFFAGLSHELRTPLAVIATQAEMLNDTGARDAIASSASQLLDLINDILELARAEAGSINVHIQPISLSALVTDLAPMLEHLGDAANVEVHVEGGRGIPEVLADPARLRQVIVNLVDNAIKYTPAGGEVRVVVGTEDGFARLEVHDTGVGIPTDAGERVFDPFYRVPSTSPQRNQASSGLGLALARSSVEAQGGTIEWHPRSDHGTTFSFTIPIARSTRRGNRSTRTKKPHGSETNPDVRPAPRAERGETLATSGLAP